MLHSRDKRIEESIRQALAEAIQFQVSDPRVPTIFTITEVSVAKDLRNAKVYYSQMPDDDEALEMTKEFLRDSGGFLRSAVARAVNLKFTPVMHFSYDPSHKNYQRINTKLNEMKRSGQLPDAEPEPSEDPES